jgi:hypothetical protein
VTELGRDRYHQQKQRPRVPCSRQPSRRPQIGAGLQRLNAVLSTQELCSSVSRRVLSKPIISMLWKSINLRRESGHDQSHS